MNRMVGLLAVAMALSLPVWTRSVAITIDDLPRGGDGLPRDLQTVRGMTGRFLAPFQAERIPLTGFVISGLAKDVGEAGMREILNMWLDAGADLGNHTYSHNGLNEMPADQYEADIVKGEPLLQELLAKRGKQLRYFRYPMLQAGPTPEIKKSVADFLAARGYSNAPVTFDDSDYMFAAVYGDALKRGDAGMAARVKREYVPYLESVIAFFERRGDEVVGRDFSQILLLHANQLNAEMMPGILTMLKRRGYNFVSLDFVLADPAYQQPENYAGRGGFSWIHRWSMTKGMPNKGEPGEPEWINREYKRVMRR